MVCKHSNSAPALYAVVPTYRTSFQAHGLPGRAIRISCRPSWLRCGLVSPQKPGGRMNAGHCFAQASLQCAGMTGQSPSLSRRS